MPQYTVPITGRDGTPGTITVNASDPGAATDNARQGGNTPTGAPVLVGGSPSSGSGGGSGGATSGGGGGSGGTGANLQAGQLLLNQAQQAAYQAYLNARLALDTDQEAYQKAAQAAQTVLNTAQVTGYYQPNAGAQSFYNGQFVKSKDIGGGGGWSVGQVQNGKFVPFANSDQFTQAGGDWSQVDQMPTVDSQTFIGMANGTIDPLTAGMGTPTLANQQQQFQHGIDAAQLTGVYNGMPTLAAQNQQQQTALSYLNLLSNLRGPQDYGQYLKVLGSTPNGLSDLVSSALGQYVPGGGTTGINPTPASIPGLLNPGTNGATGGRLLPGGQAVMQSAPGSGSGSQVFEQNGAPSIDRTFPGGTTPPASSGVPGTVAAWGSGTPLNTKAGGQYDVYMQQANALPAPNQISPNAWNAYSPSQKQLILGMYQSRGFDPNDVQDLYNRSLPKYGGMAGAGTVRLS